MKKVRNLSIRKVSYSDVDLLFSWSNDTLVRSQSFQTDEIPYASHCIWLKNKIEDANALLLIVEVDNVSAGIVKFEIKDNNAIIGISIGKNFRGQSLGAEFLKIGLKQYFQQFNLPVMAYIKKDNIASVKIFEKAGFMYNESVEIGGVDSLIYKIKK